ncbi:hypothetical protein E2F47_25520 [Mycobacterium eburneum]|nr:hypothetical protein [Mycobacterium eburneum]TDH48006.1 hypothetical protein E2F47_25520 [Mycobacterium eburneum]
MTRADTVEAAAAAGGAPKSRARRRRTAALWLVMVCAGAALTLSDSPFWAAFGVGLWFPGAGFLAAGGWWSFLTVVTVVVFVVSLIAWFGAGFTTLPPLVWLVSALAAGALAASEHAVSRIGTAVAAGLTALFVVAGFVGARRSRAAAGRRRATRDGYLPRAIATARAVAQPPPTADALELDPETLAGLRYVFDRALQPPGSYDGYDSIDQFQTAALRYQINYLGYALAVTQCHYTPNFHGYQALAQRNLIETYLNRRVWGYWAWENAWGNLRLNADPVGKDNIMLTGFFGLQVGLYTALTGDQRYLQPGGLSFGRYEHDLHDVVGSLVGNYARAPYTLFPCEPNWIYTACNFRGMGALQVYDRITGSAHFDAVAEEFRERLEVEFVKTDYGMVSLKSKHTGIDLPFPLPDAVPAVYLNSMFPDIAERYWAILRTEAFDDHAGTVKPLIPKVAVDMGNYRPGYGLAMESLYGAAREFGDIDAARAAARALDELCDPVTDDGVLTYRTMSNAVNACVTLDRQLHHGFWRQTVLRPTPPSALHGPLLEEAAYPDVLVARAVSSGEDLHLVLYPGGAQARQRIVIARLQPGRHYQISGVTENRCTADASGRIALHVELRDRTEVRLAPISAHV